MDLPRACDTACALPAAPLPGARSPCPPAPPDEQLEAALRSSDAEVWLDACRVVRKLASAAATHCALLELSSRPIYLEERGADFIRECTSQDGALDQERVEHFTDAGWSLRTSTFSPSDGGLPVRWTETPLRWGKWREVREVWRDGGWQLDSDGVQMKPRVLPIQP